VSDKLLDEETTIVLSTVSQQETSNTFGRNFLQRLGIAHSHTVAEAASSQSSPNTKVSRKTGCDNFIMLN